MPSTGSNQHASVNNINLLLLLNIAAGKKKGYHFKICLSLLCVWSPLYMEITSVDQSCWAEQLSHVQPCMTLRPSRVYRGAWSCHAVYVFLYPFQSSPPHPPLPVSPLSLFAVSPSDRSLWCLHSFCALMPSRASFLKKKKKVHKGPCWRFVYSF